MIPKICKSCRYRKGVLCKAGNELYDLFCEYECKEIIGDSVTCETYEPKR